MPVHENGLTQQEVAKLLEKHGKNVLPEEKSQTALDHFFSQFTSPLIYILVIAGVITFILKDYKDSIVILAAVMVNTLLGFYQESKAEQALQALKNILNPETTVIRDGEKQEIDIRELVPGDIVLLAEGDRVPADCVLLEAVQVSANEALLTGESTSVSKKKKDTVFMGSTIMSGRAVAVVAKTGAHTKMGSIAHKITILEDTKTPLQERIDHLAKMLAIIVVGLSVVIFVVGILTGRSFIEMFTTSVALAVASIPEGLAISLTVILAVGMQRILKKKALVRRLVAAETLGSVTIIATDKTGTLTEGLMRVTETELEHKEMAIKVSMFANNLEDPLEVALWEWVHKQGKDPQKIVDGVTRSSEVPFNSDRKYMSVTIDNTTYIKGAPEVLLHKTDASDAQKKSIRKKIESWSAKGRRLIGLAYKKGSKTRWVGLVGLEDPIRKDIHSVFDTCSKAGIRIIMITGDYSGTAESIWRQIYPKAQDVIVVDGEQLKKMSDTELIKRLPTIDIFARVSPAQKLRIVEMLRKQKEVVALVGDGVNDAPAIKKANIGIVVGSASDVAKETADMILLDSNFKTIVNAIEEGRGIFENMRKVILYLLTDAFTEILLVVGTLMMGLPLPLTAAQILWINIITDGLPAISLTLEPKSRNLLKRKPVDADLPLIDKTIKILISVVSGVTGILSLVIFVYYHNRVPLEEARTITFAALAFGTLVYIFSVRSLTVPIWKINQFKNKFLIVAVLIGTVIQIAALEYSPLTSFLETQPLTAGQWQVVALFTVSIIVIIEITKALLHYIDVYDGESKR